MKLEVNITIKLEESQLKMILEQLPKELAQRLKGEKVEC